MFSSPHGAFLFFFRDMTTGCTPGEPWRSNSSRDLTGENITAVLSCYFCFFCRYLVNGFHLVPGSVVSCLVYLACIFGRPSFGLPLNSGKYVPGMICVLVMFFFLLDLDDFGCHGFLCCSCCCETTVFVETIRRFQRLNHGR